MPYATYARAFCSSERMRSLEQKALAYVSEREGGFAAFLFSSANAEFAQVRVKTLSTTQHTRTPRARRSLR
jgi:hypothetical protein